MAISYRHRLEALSKTLILLILLSAQSAYANTVWDWSFNGESGQFITDTGNGGAAGVYSLIDFTVTASASGQTIGSLTGLDYSTGDFNTDLPYLFIYDGSNVTSWLQSGTNGFSWWVFQDNSTADWYFFGWDTGNFNDPTKAAVYDGVTSLDDLPAYDISVNPTVVPIPAAAWLFLSGLIGLVWKSRKARQTLT